MIQLNYKQARKLKKLAHRLKAVVMLGKGGITENLIIAVNDALEARELIKLKFIGNKEERKELSEKIAVETDSTLVQIVGNISTFYRQNADETKRKIVL